MSHAWILRAPGAGPGRDPLISSLTGEETAGLGCRPLLGAHSGSHSRISPSVLLSSDADT